MLDLLFFRSSLFCRCSGSQRRHARTGRFLLPLSLLPSMLTLPRASPWTGRGNSLRHSPSEYVQPAGHLCFVFPDHEVEPRPIQPDQKKRGEKKADRSTSGRAVRIRADTTIRAIRASPRLIAVTIVVVVGLLGYTCVVFLIHSHRCRSLSICSLSCRRKSLSLFVSFSRIVSSLRTSPASISSFFCRRRDVFLFLSSLVPQPTTRHPALELDGPGHRRAHPQHATPISSINPPLVVDMVESPSPVSVLSTSAGQAPLRKVKAASPMVHPIP